MLWFYMPNAKNRLETTCHDRREWNFFVKNVSLSKKLRMFVVNKKLSMNRSFSFVDCDSFVNQFHLNAAFTRINLCYLCTMNVYVYKTVQYGTNTHCRSLKLMWGQQLSNVKNCTTSRFRMLDVNLVIIIDLKSRPRRRFAMLS